MSDSIDGEVDYKESYFKCLEERDIARQDYEVMPIDSDSWETPPELFTKLDEEFGFEFDLCASVDNHRCNSFATDIEAFVDGMISGVVEFKPKAYWCNPPYSRGNIGKCMRSVVKLSNALDSPIVTLTRFDPSTDWFQTYVDGVADEVRMLAHRVKFKGATDSYNFPCCLALYNLYEGRFVVGSYPLVTNYYIWSWK